MKELEMRDTFKEFETDAVSVCIWSFATWGFARGTSDSCDATAARINSWSVGVATTSPEDCFSFPSFDPLAELGTAAGRQRSLRERRQPVVIYLLH